MNPGFTHPHWAGIRDRTHPFGLAVSCVFQPGRGDFPFSPSSCLLNSRPSLVTATCGPSRVALLSKTPPSRPQAPLLPKLRGQFADFPGAGSPIHLPLLREPTCVGSQVRSWGILAAPLFTGPRNRRNFPYGKPFPPSPPSPHYETPEASVVSLRPPIPRRRRAALRRRTYPHGTGILTGFPFGYLG